MYRPPNSSQDFNYNYLTEGSEYEILYRMRDALGNLHAVPCSKVEYALSNGITFDGEQEAELYGRENKDAPSVKERRGAILTAVKESLEREQQLRNEKAAEYGWPIHPNDVEGLTPEQHAAMLEAWSLRQPPPEFLNRGVS